MSAEIVNLRRVRKDKARAGKAKTAAERRASFGVPRADRKVIDLALDTAERRLDGHRLLRSDGDAS